MSILRPIFDDDPGSGRDLKNLLTSGGQNKKLI